MIHTQIKLRKVCIALLYAILVTVLSFAIWTRVVRNINSAEKPVAEVQERPVAEAGSLLSLARMINLNRPAAVISHRIAVAYIDAQLQKEAVPTVSHSLFELSSFTRSHLETKRNPVVEEETEEEVVPYVAPGSWIGELIERKEPAIPEEVEEETVTVEEVLEEEPEEENLHSASNSELDVWEISHAWNISIPSIGVRAPILLPSMKYWKQQLWGMLEEQMQVGLNHGAVAYPHSMSPGKAGSLIIAGHSSPPTARAEESVYGNMFAQLPNVQIGDEISVLVGGTPVKYIVEEKKVVSPSETSILAQQNEEGILKLITCYPIGTTRDRMIVIAKLQSDS